MKDEYLYIDANIIGRSVLGLVLSLFSVGIVGCVKSSTEDSEAVKAEQLAYQQSPKIPFCGLGDLPGGEYESHAFGVSADGRVVVGKSVSSNGKEEAFRWKKDGGMRGLGVLWNEKRECAGIQSRADSVSDDGTVVVGSSVAGSTKAFRWTQADGMQDLGSLPGRYPTSSATGISGDGATIVGQSSSVGGSEAFRWTKADGMKGIGRLPGGGESSGSASSAAQAISGDGQTIVGSSKSSNGSEAFLLNKSGMQALGDLPGGRFQSEGTGVSGDGSIFVGSGYPTPGEQQAFKWTVADGMKALDDLPGGHLYCTACAISRDGSTIFGAGYSEVGSEAVRWTDDKGVQSIRQLLIDQGVEMSGWRLWVATAVSDDGAVVVGYGLNPQKKWEAWRADLSGPVAAK